jgi:NADH-quinone oxidoreductase subunit N
MFVLDRMAIFFKIFIVTTTILVILASVDYVKRFKFFKGEYYFLVLMSALGMMFMSSANDLLSIFITLEFSTFGFYVLVAYLREDPASNEAGLKFFILGIFAAGLLAYGISLVYGETGKIVLSDIASAPATPGLVIGYLLIFAALGFKIGAAPFHSWIPDTYHGAPTPVTAFLSIAPKGAAFAILLRLFFISLAAFKPVWVLLLVLVSILSMTYGNIVAIAQKNIKRLLAYSGIAQIGNILIGLAAGTKMGSDAILFYLLTYLFANLGAFAIVIAVGNLINSDEIEDYNGLNRRSPFLAFAMLVFLLSLAGVPPLAGFIGKLYIFVAAIKEGLYTLIIVGLINVVISIYYYLVIVKKMYINEPVDNSLLTISAPMKTVIYASLAGTLILGIYPQPVIDWVVSATLMFSRIVAPAAAIAPATVLPFGG